MYIRGKTYGGAARNRRLRTIESLAILKNVLKCKLSPPQVRTNNAWGGVVHCREGKMDRNRTYDRVAENYFQALLRSGHDTLEAARDMEDAAAFLAAEGQLEVAQALREISLKHRTAENPTAVDRATA